MSQESSIKGWKDWSFEAKLLDFPTIDRDSPPIMGQLLLDSPILLRWFFILMPHFALAQPKMGSSDFLCCRLICLDEGLWEENGNNSPAWLQYLGVSIVYCHRHFRGRICDFGAYVAQSIGERAWCFFTLMKPSTRFGPCLRRKDPEDGSFQIWRACLLY